MVVSEAADIERILGALIRHGAIGQIRDAKTLHTIQPLAMSPRLGVMQWRLPEAATPPPLKIEMIGYNSLFYFVCDQAFQTSTALTTSLPSRLVRIRQRWERRVGVEDLSIQHQDHPNLKLIDISYNGIAFESQETLPSDAELTGLTVQLQDHAQIPMQAIIVGTSAQGGRVRYHARIKKLLKRNASWSHLVNDRLHPGTRLGSEFSEDVWRLYQESGYLNLSGKDPSRFSSLRRAHMSVVKVLDRAPHLGVQVVWPNSDGKIDAAVSMLKTYKHAWLGIHMARVSGESASGISGRRVLRELLTRVMEHVARDPELKWTISYTQVKKVWSRGFYHDLAAQHVESGDAAIVRFRALEFEVDSLPVNTAITVDNPDDDELIGITYSIRKLRPRAYCDALDLVPKRIEMASIEQQWKRCRLERERHVLVARSAGKPVAVAILEIGADGTHLFGLLDLVRLYPLQPGGEESFEALLQQCGEWFRSKGKERFVLYLEEDDVRLPTTVSAHACDMGLADQVFLSVRKIPELLEHLHQLTAPRTQEEQISAAAPQ